MKKNTDRDNLTWELVSEEHPVRDEWIDFRKCTYQLPDGTEFGPYYSYSRRSYVVIVARNTDGKYLCVRQFRQGIRQITTEFPAGGIERKGETDYVQEESGLKKPAVCPDSPEEALAAARRELLEETGHKSDDWTHLLTVPSNATIADNYAHLFLAKQCRPVQEQHLDDTEFLSVQYLTADEIDGLIREGAFQQAVHVLAWELAKKESV